MKELAQAKKDSKAKKFVLSFVSILFPVVLIYFSQKHFNFKHAIENISYLKVQTIFWCFIFLCLSRFFQALRFRALYNASLGPALHAGISLTAQFVNAVVPMRGGEIVRPFYLLKMGHNVSLSGILMATLVDKVIEALCLIPFVLLGFYFFKNEVYGLLMNKTSMFESGYGYLWIAGALVVGLLATQYFKKKYHHLWVEVFSHSKKLPLCIVMGTLHWLCFVLAFNFIVGDLDTGLFVSLASNFASAVPIAPGSIGVFEAAFVWSSKLANSQLSNDMLLAQAMVIHFFYLIIPILGGSLFFMKFGIPKKD